MQTYFGKKNFKIFVSFFFTLFIFVSIILPILESFNRAKFYSWKILSIKNLIKSAVENFIQCVDFYPVRREFYPVRRILPSVETFIKCRDFYPM